MAPGGMGDEYESTCYSFSGPMGELLRITYHGDPDDLPMSLQRLLDLAERGRLVQVMYRPCASPWERLCALEEDLLKAENQDMPEHIGWSIVAGECVMLDGVTGWLEHGDGWVLVACGPEYVVEHGTDFLFLTLAEFEERFVPYERGRAALGDDSGIRLNRALREVAALEAAFAGGEEDVI